MEGKHNNEFENAIQIPKYSDEETNDGVTEELQETTKDRNPYIFILLILLFAGVGVFLYSFNPAYEFIAGFFVSMRELGFLGVVLLTTIFTFWIIIMLPAMLLEVFAGFVYKDQFYNAIIISFFGKLFGMLIIYVISRKFLRNSKFAKKPLLRALNNAIKEQQTRFIILIRLSLLPLFVKNYGLSVLDVRFWNYAIISTLASFPMSLWNNYMGAKSAQILDKDNDSSSRTESLILLIIAIVASVLLFMYLAFLTRKVMRELKEYQTSSKIRCETLDETLVKIEDAHMPL